MPRGWVSVPALCLLSACNLLTPSEYKRDVEAFVSGPSTLLVGDSVQLSVRLQFSDGTTLDNENFSADWASSDPGVATVASCPPQCGPNTPRPGLVTGVSSGQVVIRAVPKVTTTGTGDRRPGTLLVTVRRP